MIKIHIVDGSGSDSIATVLEDGSLLTSIFPYPPLVQQKTSIFRQFFTDDGTATGNYDMRVNGSVTPVEFYIPSCQCDLYITTLSFVIADLGAVLNKFGNITALTNGCHLFYESISRTVDIHPALKSNWDFVRLCLGTPPIGATTNAFLASSITPPPGSEGYIPVLDLTRFLPPYGIKLDRNSTQRLVLEVRDDTRAIDAFDCIAYGFLRSE